MLRLACQEVHASQGLIHLLQAVLGVGNYLNQGTFKGSAAGLLHYLLAFAPVSSSFTYASQAQRPCQISMTAHQPLLSSTGRTYVSLTDAPAASAHVSCYISVPLTFDCLQAQVSKIEPAICYIQYTVSGCICISRHKNVSCAMRNP